LAGLGEEPRAYAVRLLLERLDDPASTAEDLIESATALTEIGSE